MAHTFDIRFARSTGLSGLLEAPANSFRWRGSGTLRIDTAGVSFAVRCGLLSLFAGRRRIEAANLEQVYREGHALHLTFTSKEHPRASVSCWAADAGTAAEIVGLLPTRRTIELEHSLDAAKPAGPRFDRRAVGALLLFCAIFFGGAALLMPAHEVVPPAARPMIEAPNIAVAVNLEASKLVLPADFIVTIPRDSPQYAVASRQLAAFEKDAEALLLDYRIDRKLLESGAMDSETFTHRLATLELAWWAVSYRMLDDSEFAAMGLLDIRATLLASARHWRAFLASHAEGIRKGDHVMIAKSFDEMTKAEQMLSKARLYVR
jgi:hypothetical protein